MRTETTWDADEAVTQLYAAHYTSLVRLGALLLRDAGAAEDVVQDAFVAMHGKWGRLRDPHKAHAYLRQAVVNRARSALRHRSVVARHRPEQPANAPGADRDVLRHEQRSQVLAALDGLSQRQREVLVLRFYLDLSEEQIADTLGISKGAVKSHASRGLDSLRTAWEHSS
ncbi:MAG TPA: SigE family RNA polymerase sigma factor [Nocardioidaceae bacterium]|nr:SigE family RNA polymerase sigma factor [Nocardioidaceae bacterium]